MKRLLRTSLSQFRKRWKPLAVTDVLFKLIAVALLSPLVAICFRWFLSLSGEEVLADVDVLHFALTPVGLICLITVGALSLGISALEMASLMGVLASRPDKSPPVLRSIRFASDHALPVFRVTLRIVARVILIAIPFLAIAGCVYAFWLTEYDINYYLKARPPVFQLALGIGGVLAIGLAAILIYATSGWLIALPLVLFEKVPASQALKVSQQRTVSIRWVLIGAITAWCVAITLVSSLLTGLVLMIGRGIVDRAAGSLTFLAVAIGISLLVSALANLVVNVIGTTSFASLLFSAYRLVGEPNEEVLVRLERLEEERDSRGVRVTKTRLAFLLLAGFLVAALLGAWIARDIRLDDDVAIIAHRGASASAPENTLASVRRAIEEGTDWVEIDVQETADGQVVVFHDSDFMKLAGVDRKIWEVTVDELETIDVGSNFDSQFKDERVPTLAQVLETCKGKAGVNIELKYYGHNQQLEQRVIDLVESHEMTDDVIFMSLKRDAVTKMKELRPEWKTGLLLSVSFGDLRNLRADFLAINARFASRSLIRRAHELDKQVFVWTVNDPVTMAVMVGRGVDGLITDQPALAKQVVAQRSELNAAERLMLEFAEIFGITPEIGEQ
jgi:glycerophosphoryl diester phosphodiesterase